MQFLGLHVEVGGDETYDVLGPHGPARLQHLGERRWRMGGVVVELGTPDEVFATAVGLEGSAESVPHWPDALRSRLARSRSSGPCAIAFDADWFIDRLTTTALDVPLLFPRGVEALGLGDGGLVRTMPLIPLLQRAGLREGRLIGASTWGDLVQLGTDIEDGCRAAIGSGPLELPLGAPLGIGLGPRIPSAAVLQGRDGESAGVGAEVGGVEQGGAADLAGVTEGMAVLEVAGQAVSDLDFEDVLEAIDACGAGDTVVFDTASLLSHWYAVEMPAEAALRALGASKLQLYVTDRVLWREPIPRLFMGQAGSVTCAHVDICPQVQVARGLLGTKLLGVASHAKTPELLEEHGQDVPTVVPTDQPLSSQQLDLLEAVTVMVVEAGDLAVLHSGALHFASNGAEGMNAAIYHGLMTHPCLPRLREAAAVSRPPDAAYADHLYAADLLALVESGT